MNATAAMMKNETAAEETVRGMDAGSLQYELTGKLAARMHITLEEAREALEAAGWNELTAAYRLEKEDFRRKMELEETAANTERTVSALQTVSCDHYEHTAGGGKETMKKLGRTAMDLIARGNRSRFVIRRGGRQLMDLPVTILVLLFLCSFGTGAFLLVAGLFAGCQYSFSDPAKA